MSTTPDHYTARIDITVSEIEIPDTTKYENRNTKPEPTRSVRQVTSLVVRAKTIESLQQKITAHVALIEDDNE